MGNLGEKSLTDVILGSGLLNSSNGIFYVVFYNFNQIFMRFEKNYSFLENLEILIKIAIFQCFFHAVTCQSLSVCKAFGDLYPQNIFDWVILITNAESYYFLKVDAKNPYKLLLCKKLYFSQVCT